MGGFRCASFYMILYYKVTSSLSGINVNKFDHSGSIVPYHANKVVFCLRFNIQGSCPSSRLPSQIQAFVLHNCLQMLQTHRIVYKCRATFFNFRKGARINSSCNPFFVPSLSQDLGALLLVRLPSFRECLLSVLSSFK